MLHMGLVTSNMLHIGLLANPINFCLQFHLTMEIARKIYGCHDYKRLLLIMDSNSELRVSTGVLLRLENDLSQFIDGRTIPDDTLDSMIVFFEFVYRELLAFQATSYMTQAQEEAMGFVRNCLYISRSISEQRMISHRSNSPLAIPVSYQGCVGSYNIPYEQLHI